MTADNPTRTPSSPLRRARLTFFLVAVVVPIVISAIGVVVLLAWLPSMPDQVAIHWGVDGADGFGPASTYVWILLGVGLVLPVLMAIITLAAVGAQWGGAARLMGALAAGMAAFATVLSLGSLAMQRDLAAGADVPGIGLVLAGSFATLAAVGAVAWAVQPQVRPESGPTLEPRQAVRIAEGSASSGWPRPRCRVPRSRPSCCSCSRSSRSRPSCSVRVCRADGSSRSWWSSSRSRWSRPRRSECA